jgi:hypothetical protein
MNSKASPKRGDSYEQIRVSKDWCSAAQAQGIKGLRKIRQILEQHDAAIARLTAATNERIREAVTADDSGEADEPVAATA